MRKLVVSEFVSLDGVMEGPGGDDGYVHGPWTVPYFCEEIAAAKFEELRAADTLLLGRRTYDGFALAWPERTDDDFSDRMNSIAKAVVSSTLETAAWANTTVLRGGIESIGELKATDGGDILVVGSASLVHALLASGLVDELRIVLSPVVLGVGVKLFPDDVRLDFHVADVRPTSTGALIATYRRAELGATPVFDYDAMKARFPTTGTAETA